MASSQQKDFLDPAFLLQLQNYSLMAKVVVEGFLSGMHRSLFHGFGTEFLQYRNYTPGEDLKYLDWKVLAKSDRLYTKVYQEETNMNCYIILDCSASLDYQGDRAPSNKLRYASMIAACIAYLASRQGDNIGLFAYSDQLHEVIEPGHRIGQLNRFLQALTRLQPSGTADHAARLHTLTHQFSHRGIVIYISDMLEGETILPQMLRRFRFCHCDCLAIQVLDPDELDLPQARVTRYMDCESQDEITTFPEVARRAYAHSMQAFLEQLQQAFAKSQVEYLRLISTDPVGAVLARYLSHRDRF